VTEQARARARVSELGGSEGRLDGQIVLVDRGKQRPWTRPRSPWPGPARTWRCWLAARTTESRPSCLDWQTMPSVPLTGTARVSTLGGTSRNSPSSARATRSAPWIGCGTDGTLPPPAGAQHHLGIQRRKQLLQVSARTGRQEGAGGPLPLVRIDVEAWPTFPHMTARAACELACRGSGPLRLRSRHSRTRTPPAARRSPAPARSASPAPPKRGRQRLRQHNRLARVWEGEHGLGQPTDRFICVRRERRSPPGLRVPIGGSANLPARRGHDVR
jgi:hypothetical protein